MEPRLLSNFRRSQYMVVSAAHRVKRFLSGSGMTDVVAVLTQFHPFLSRLTVLGAEPELGEQRVKYKTRSKCAQEIDVAQDA